MSKNILHKNRNGCALHGALKAINAVDGFVPIIHSSAGCSIHSKLSENILTGSNGTYYRGWLETSATDVIEKQVVFGGTARLREQIKNTVKVQPASLYVVVTGCAPEIVGDDVPAMVKEAQEQGFPVITASTPGFKGNVYKGFQWAVKSIIERISQSHVAAEVQSGTVNVLGVVPNQDLFWEGNLDNLERLFAHIGIKTNKLFGYNQTKESWRNAPNAELNLVVSPWGLEAAKLLEQKFGTPYLYLGYLSVGEPDSSTFLRLIGEKLSIDKDLIDEAIAKEEHYLSYQLQKLAQTYLTYDFQKEIAIVGETSNVIGVARFLQETFGQLVTTVIITDTPDSDLHDQIRDSLTQNPNFATQISFTSNGEEVDKLLRKAKPQFILGSTLEESVANELAVPLLKISTPVFDRPFLNHSYIGYSGAVTLLQDYSEAVLKGFFLKQLKSNPNSEKFKIKDELKSISIN